MKTKLTFKLSLMLLLLTPGYQTLQAQTKDEIQIIQGIWGMQKQDIVMQYMNFSDSEQVKFLPIYNAYMDEYKQLGVERIKILGEYADSYTSITNEKADNLTQRLLKNNAAIDKLQLNYYNKIKKSISAVRASQFMQLELYMQTMIRADIQSNIPMIGDLEKAAK